MPKTSKNAPVVDAPGTPDDFTTTSAGIAQAIERRVYALAGVAAVLHRIAELTMDQDFEGWGDSRNLQNGLFDLEKRITEHRDAIIDLAFSKGGAR